MRNRVNINGVQVPVRHAAFARFAIDGYKYVKNSLSKKTMAPITPPNSKKRKYNSAPKPAANNPVLPITKATSRHRGKTTNFKKPKKTHVSKKFKDKVVKSLEAKTTSGSWDQISFDSIKASSYIVNGQFVGGLGAFTTNDFSDWAFDPEDFLHAASVLWNGKTDSQSQRTWISTSNLGYSENGGVSITDVRTATSSRFQCNTKLTIKKSWESYKLKNNTQRTIVMKIYLCAPKMVGFKSTNSYPMPRQGDVAVTQYTAAPIGDPGSVWANELQKQVYSNQNIAAAVPESLYNSPKKCPGFNAIYKTDETTVVLEPGQVYDYYIQGPSNFVLDYSKLFKGQGVNPELSYYHGIQKFMRYPLITTYMDTVTDGILSGHYPPSVAKGGSLAVSIERRLKFALEMPDNVGTFMSVAGTLPFAGNVEMNNRRDCYFKVVYTPTAATAPLFGVSVQDPTETIMQT